MSVLNTFIRYRFCCCSGWRAGTGEKAETITVPGAADAAPSTADDFAPTDILILLIGRDYVAALSFE